MMYRLLSFNDGLTLDLRALCPCPLGYKSPFPGSGRLALIRKESGYSFCGIWTILSMVH